MRPAVGVRNLVSRLNTVVLPAPFGPISACTAPLRIRRSTSRTAKNPLNSRSEEHTSELQSLMRISYAVFCLKKKTTQYHTKTNKLGKKQTHNTTDSSKNNKHNNIDKQINHT